MSDKSKAERAAKIKFPGCDPMALTGRMIWADGYAAGQAEERGRAENVIASLEDILRNVALDWYIEVFSRDTRPQGTSTGTVAQIHNKELVQRARIAFEKARRELKSYKDGEPNPGGEGE